MTLNLINTDDNPRSNPSSEPSDLRGARVEAVAPAARDQRMARIVLAVVLVALGAYTVREFIPAMAWAGVFAIATWRLYARARPHVATGRHNIMLPLMATLVVGLVFVAPLGAVLVKIGHEAHAMAEWSQDARQNGIPVPQQVEHLPLVSTQVGQWWSDNLSTPEGISDLFGRVDHDKTVQMGRHVGGELAHRMTTFAFMLVTLFFLYREGEALASDLVASANRLFGPSGARLSVQMVASIHGTVDGLVLVGLGEGAIMGVAYLALGVPHAVMLGGLTAIAAMIPFGAAVACGLAALLLVAKGSTAAAIAVVVVGLVVTGVADHFVRPVLIGGTTQLPFLWVLFGILGGVASFGLLGLFVGPAILSALIMLWRDWKAGLAMPAQALD